MNKARRDWLLGLVFFGGLGLLLWATQTLNGLSFTPKQVLSVRFENARGLRVGESVFVLGTLSGKVKTVDVDDDAKNPVITTLELDEGLKIYKNAKIEIEDSSFLGGKKVSIHPGGGERWNKDRDQDMVFLGKAPLGPLQQLGDVISGENNKENLQQILENLAEFVKDLNEADGSLRRFIEKPGLYDDATAFVASIRKAAEELENKKSLLGRIVYDEELGAKTNKIFSDLEKVTDQLTKTDSPIGRLVNDKNMGDKLKKIVDDAEIVTDQLTKSESPLGRFINDKTLGKKINTIVDDVARVTTSLNDPDSGLLGALLNDKTMLADARKIFADARKIFADINSGKGALGRLINDEDMGRRLDSLIRQITRAVEDAREAAPIGTFFQVFSGAF